MLVLGRGGIEGGGVGEHEAVEHHDVDVRDAGEEGKPHGGEGGEADVDHDECGGGDTPAAGRRRSHV